LAYLREFQELDMEVATEFLVMAATLLLIKSRMLLPKPVKVQEGEFAEEKDPRQELIERLLQYRRYREAADGLQLLLQQRRRYFHRLPQAFSIERALPTGMQVQELLEAFASLWETVAEEFRTIVREEITVQEKMADIIRLLEENRGQMEFRQALTRSGSRTEIISSFLAILELIRLRRIKVIQTEPFGPISLAWKE
jgi:segregation and condensation protein A